MVRIYKRILAREFGGACHHLHNWQRPYIHLDHIILTPKSFIYSQIIPNISI